MKKSKIIVLLTFFAAAVLVSCADDEKEDAVKLPVVLDHNLRNDLASYERGIRERAGNTEPRFVIDTLYRVENILSVKVTSGCPDDAFTFIWNGELKETDPITASFLLVLDSDASCGTAATSVLKLDVSKVFPSGTNLNRYYFEVLNGDIQSDVVLNPNGQIARKN